MKACANQWRLARRASTIALWGLGALAGPACQPKDADLYLAAGGRVEVMLSDARSAKLTEAIGLFLNKRLDSNPATRMDQLVSVDVASVRFVTHRTYAGITASRNVRVFRRTRPSGDRSIGAPVSCRVREKGEAWVVVSCRVGRTEFGPGNRLKRPFEPGHGSTGIASCDKLEVYLRCYAKTLPKAQSAALLRTWRMTVRGYRRSLKDPANRTQVAKRCQRGLDQYRRNVSMHPNLKHLKGCLR